MAGQALPFPVQGGEHLGGGGVQQVGVGGLSPAVGVDAALRRRRTARRPRCARSPPVGLRSSRPSSDGQWTTTTRPRSSRRRSPWQHGTILSNPVRSSTPTGAATTRRPSSPTPSPRSTCASRSAAPVHPPGHPVRCGAARLQAVLGVRPGSSNGGREHCRGCVARVV